MMERKEASLEEFWLFDIIQIFYDGKEKSCASQYDLRMQ